VRYRITGDIHEIDAVLIGAANEMPVDPPE
jgi:hypothetical protein